MKTRAIRAKAAGGPEVFQLETIELAPLAAGEARVRQRAIGINFIDVYHRTGLYPVAMPATLGVEGAGVVVETGPGVTWLEPGDRVAYGGAIGAYAEVRNIAADKLVKLPPGIDEKTAAGGMMKGMTACYLLLAVGKVKSGQTLVVHAAAGGTGRLLVEWALALGARVIAVVSSAKKAAEVQALANPDDTSRLRVVVTSDADFVKESLDFTGGRGVDMVFDSVGKDTFLRSLDCLRTRGMMVSFGQASGPIGPVDLGVFAKKSLFFTRPSLFNYVATREELERTAQDLFDVLAADKVHVQIGRTFRFEEIPDAHRALESRATTGSSVVLVEGG